MIRCVEDLVAWYERQTWWAGLLLFPILAPLLMAYSLISLSIFLLIYLPYTLIVGSKHPEENPAAKFSLAEVRQHSESLAKWFHDNRQGNEDCLGSGPDLACQLARLAGSPDLTREQAEAFAERVQEELRGYKGSPFFALYYLSRRLPEVTNHQRAA